MKVWLQVWLVFSMALCAGYDSGPSKMPVPSVSATWRGAAAVGRRALGDTQNAKEVPSHEGRSQSKGPDRTMSQGGQSRL
jgi:hypothetical protein